MIQIILAIFYVAISIYLHYQTHKLYRKEQEKNEKIVNYISQEIFKSDRRGKNRRKALRDIKQKINEIRL